MKTILEVLCLAFSVMMVVRLVEMSIVFDGIDILWFVVFLIAALICGAVSKKTTNS